MLERRQLPRLTIDKEAKMKLDSDEEFRRCVIKDIHLKGACLKMTQPLFQNYCVKMVLTLAENMELDIQVDVPWFRQREEEYVYGLMFRKIPDDDKDKVYQYIQRHCAKQIREKWWG